MRFLSYFVGNNKENSLRDEVWRDGAGASDRQEGDTYRTEILTALLNAQLTKLCLDVFSIYLFGRLI